MRGRLEQVYNAGRGGDGHVTSFRRYLKRGPTEDGGYRRRSLVQFYTDPGGLRTVEAEDIVIG